MASGLLGQSALSAATNTSVYQVPSSKVAALNINAVNRGATSALVRLALASTTSPGNAEYIEYDVEVPAKGVLERTGIVLDASKRVVAYASTANVSVSVYGFEEDA